MKKVLVLCLSATLANAVAEDNYWTGGTGAWEDPANWSQSGAPPWSPDLADWTDGVYLANAPGSSATATYTGAPYTSNTVGIRSLQIHGTATDAMTLSVSSGTIITAFDIWTNGVVNQTGGAIETFYPVEGSGIAFNGNPSVWSGGTYNLSGGTLTSLGDTLSIYGVMNQTGGEWVGLDSAVYVFQGGVVNLSVTGVMNNATHMSVRGTFNQEGATVVRGSSLSVTATYPNELGGTYNLSGGDLDMGWVGLADGSTFNQSGGTVTVARRNEYSVVLVGTDLGGTYNLSGGRLEAGRVTVDDRFNYSGGELVLGYQEADGSWVAGTLTNSGTTTLSGSGTRTIDGNVINTGTFQTTHTTAAYTGTFINNGAYISDPSTQYFVDLIVNESGYLVGQDGDEFYLSGDFENYSEMSLYWNTMHASLGFVEGDDSLHDFYLAGEDFGATLSGYINNFSWGTLDIGDNSLYLFDGNDEFGAALYVGELWGAELFGDTVANIFGSDGLTIYYNPDQRGNDYLAGLDYNLSGGGYLRAVIPEPTTFALLGLGSLALVMVRRRR